MISVLLERLLYGISGEGEIWWGWGCAVHCMRKRVVYKFVFCLCLGWKAESFGGVEGGSCFVGSVYTSESLEP